MMGTITPKRPKKKRKRTLPDKQSKNKRIVLGTASVKRRIEPGESEPWVKSFTPFGRKDGYKKRK